jgi:hypothetical protein
MTIRVTLADPVWPAGPSVPVSTIVPGRAPDTAAGTTAPGWPPAGAIEPNRLADGSCDWSDLSRTTGAAWAASIAISWAGFAWPSAATASERVTPRAAVTAPAWLGSSGAGGSTWTSPPVAKAAWSEADRSQLACCDSASVPVATAIVSSSAALAWRSGIRASCQEASEAVSRLPRAASRAAGGSRRKVATPPAISARAGASASTGSMPAVPLSLAAE